MSKSSFRSINQAADIAKIRWPDLRLVVIRSTDGWLTYLEELTLRGKVRLPDARYRELREFLHVFGLPGTQSVATALDRVFAAQGLFCDSSDVDGEAGSAGPGGGATADEAHGDGIEGPAVRYGVG